MTWYVVYGGAEVGAESDPEDDVLQVWTVSQNPKDSGWVTDCGHPGYGLSKKTARFLVDAANEKEARDASTGKGVGMSEVKVREIAAALVDVGLSQGTARDGARAAIRAMRVPTEEMLGAGDLLCGLTRADVLEIWEAMVDEAVR